MSVCPVGSSSSAARNGELPMAQTRKYDNATPTMPPRNRNRQRFEQKLRQDVAASGPQRLAHTNFPRTLGHRDEHDVHHAHAADHQREHADEIQHELEPVGNAANHRRGIAVVAQIDGPLIARVEAMPGGQQLADLVDRLRVQLGGSTV